MISPRMPTWPWSHYTAAETFLSRTTPVNRRRLRQLSGMSARRFAEVHDFPRTTLLRWERGAKPRYPDQILRYAGALWALERSAASDSEGGAA